MSVILNPSNARSLRTRTALLTAARELIESGGPDALTMTTVADRAGVTRRTAYLHFASRTDLLIALFDHVSRTEDLASSLRPVWAAPDGRAALKEFAAHVARFHPRVLGVGGALHRARRSDPGAAAHWDVVARDQRAACRRLTGWLHREGSLAAGWTPSTAADMLWALISLDLLELLVHERGWSTRRYGRYLAEVFDATFVGRL